MFIFLDFDGVTHPVSGTPPFQTENLDALSSGLMDCPEARIVITSSWREEHNLYSLQSLLGRLGECVVGVTPVIDDPFLKNVRYHEVITFLNNTGNISAPWIAIDDTPPFYPEQCNLLVTNPYTGFTYEDAITLKNFLNEYAK